MTRKVSTVDEVLEMFRNNLVEVDVVEETALLMRNVFVIATVALFTGAVVNISLALLMSSYL